MCLINERDVYEVPKVEQVVENVLAGYMGSV